MITSSLYWKNEIKRLRRRFTRLGKIYNTYSDKVMNEFERDFFIAFYAIRKLIDAHSISDNIINSYISIKTYPLFLGKKVTMMNNHHIDDLYNLEDCTEQKLKIRDICNQVIHSYVFTILTYSEIFGQEDNDSLKEDVPFIIGGVFVSSDVKRNKLLYHITMENIIYIMHNIDTDDPNTIVRVWDKQRGDYVTKVFTFNPDEEGAFIKVDLT